MIYEKEFKCESNELCTKINDDMFDMFWKITQYGFAKKLWNDGDIMKLPVKITIKIESDKKEN